ncbi:hypothetical protein D0B54_11550 [Solimonas sp. K1W22B-7]|uniref:hypothetical protein n=1 Tax=Solimonas sp. K1W22B-7 TaxID=2303331 RepID=UPI000E32FB3B|nr:hypothetical protein [Solimonas sp. K1W22B-7]AXQ29285.1 hypothetical protein D0B54_11550 [Solimonas sp. K1W22B-7]
MKSIRVLALCLCMSVSVAPAVAAELVDPPSIAVPAGRDAGAVAKAIKLGLAQSQWAVAGEEPGHIVGLFTLRTHIAKVDIRYDTSQVAITYLDSTNLKYEQEENGQRSIHGNYNKWTAVVASNIATALSRSDLDTVDLATAAPAQLRAPVNPPPAERFSNFNRFQLMPISLEAPYAGQDPNERAAAKIAEQLGIGLGATLESWNGKAAASPRLLRIEPRIEQIRFIGVGARIFVGAMAGSSSVTLKVRFVDGQTGTLVAEPSFTVRSAGSKSAFGVGDNLMLNRVAELVQRYVADNYNEAVGGMQSPLP